MLTMVRQGLPASPASLTASEPSLKSSMHLDPASQISMPLPRMRARTWSGGHEIPRCAPKHHRNSSAPESSCTSYYNRINKRHDYSKLNLDQPASACAPVSASAPTPSSLGTKAADGVNGGSRSLPRGVKSPPIVVQGFKGQGTARSGYGVGTLCYADKSQELPPLSDVAQTVDLSSLHNTPELQMENAARDGESQTSDAAPSTSGTEDERVGVKERGATKANDRKRSVPVFVMLPLDVVTNNGELNNSRWLTVALKALKSVGVEGVMVDIWWGIVERKGPKDYDFGAYKELLTIVKDVGLRMEAVMSFHACGPNVGDDCVDVRLPPWVQDAMREDPNLMFADQWGYHNPECLSLFADNRSTLDGRTPLECYKDMMEAFKEAMGPENVGRGKTVSNVCVGCGPCGELRYPAYPENRRQSGVSQWKFPGVGEFQCYSQVARLDLASAAANCGNDVWGLHGPHDSGGYNDFPHHTRFFAYEGGSWDTEYGRFFLKWYSSKLLEHLERMLEISRKVFREEDPATEESVGAQLSIKCAGVHWWYNSRSHGAELTAGYYNTRAGAENPAHNGYAGICELCAKYDAHLNFTCVEMRDSEHPQNARCGPEGLLRQVRLTAAEYGVPIAGENAICRFDNEAYDRILSNTRATTCPEGNEIPPLSAFTFLRLTPNFLEEANFTSFVNFVRLMRVAG